MEKEWARSRWKRRKDAEEDWKQKNMYMRTEKKICSGTMLGGGELQRATFDITVWLQTDWTREVKISLAHASLIIDLPGCDPGAWRPNASRWWCDGGGSTELNGGVQREGM